MEEQPINLDFIYTDIEIIRRVIERTNELRALSNIQVEIGYYADHCTEPPVKRVKLSTWERDIYEFVIDQNTTLEEFRDELTRLSNIVTIANRAYDNNIDYFEQVKRDLIAEQARRKESGEEDLPF